MKAPAVFPQGLFLDRDIIWVRAGRHGIRTAFEQTQNLQFLHNAIVEMDVELGTVTADKYPLPPGIKTEGTRHPDSAQAVGSFQDRIRRAPRR
jgi:hypothetical protein